MTLPWVIPRKYELWWKQISFLFFFVLEPRTKQVGGCDDHHCWDINQRTWKQLSVTAIYLPQKWLMRLTIFRDNLFWPLRRSCDTCCNCYLLAARDLLASLGDIKANYFRHISLADHMWACVCFENEKVMTGVKGTGPLAKGQWRRDSTDSTAGFIYYLKCFLND